MSLAHEMLNFSNPIQILLWSTNVISYDTLHQLAKISIVLSTH